MFDEKTILARLQNGEDASTIASEMTAAINSAMKAYESQKKKEAEEAAAKEAKKQMEVQKKAEMEGILKSLIEWINKYYGIKVDTDTVSAEDTIQLIDSCFEYANALNDLSSLIGKPHAIKPIKVEVKKGNDPDDTLNAWLKSMGW